MSKANVNSLVLDGNEVKFRIIAERTHTQTPVALPAYQDYTMRAKVSELVLAASGGRTCVSEVYNTAAAFQSSIAADCVGQVGGKVATYAVDGLTGVVTVTGTVATLGADVTVTLTPTETGGGALIWKCSGTPDKYLPASCRG